MEAIFLTCLVISYFFTKGKVDTAAYANGKESPSVAKARLRHEAGGGGRSKSGRPKGKGAFRLLLADRWASACESARQRGEHRAQRRRAWYAENAPLKDAKWREKKLRRQQRADEARQKWAQRRGLIDLNEYRARKAEKEAWKENERRDAAAAAASGSGGAEAEGTAKPDPAAQASAGGAPTGETQPGGPEPGEAGSGETAAETAATPDSESPGDGQQQTRTNPREQASRMYEQDRERARRLYEEDRKRAQEAYERDRSGPHEPFADSFDVGNESSEPGVRDPIRVDGEIVRDTPEEPKQLEAAPSAAEPDVLDAEVVEDSSAPAGTPATGAGGAAPNKNGKTGKAGDSVYDAAAVQLQTAAERVEQYRQNLAAMADGLAGKQWGVEVHGPIRDMDGRLAAVAATYRDLAGQMQQQGDNVSDAHDAHPYVPADPEVVLA